MAGWGAHSGDTKASELTNTYRRIEALYLRQTFLFKEKSGLLQYYLPAPGKQATRTHENNSSNRTDNYKTQGNNNNKTTIVLLPSSVYKRKHYVRKNKDKEKKQLKFYSQFSVPQEANQQHYHVTTGKAILPASQKTVIY